MNRTEAATAPVTRRTWLRVALVAVAAVSLAPPAALADDGWWRPREGGGGTSGGGRGSRGGSGGRYESPRSPAPAPAPWSGKGWSGDSYAPPSCRWVEIRRVPVGVGPSGRTMYRITEQNSCSGKQRSYTTN